MENIKGGNNMKVIAISGPTSSGKGTLAKELQSILISRNMNVSCWGTSKPLKETLTEYGVPITMHNLQALGGFMGDEFGAHVISQYLMRLGETEGSDVVIIEGVRRTNEAQWLKDNTDCLLVYVDAPLQLRYEKFIGRNQNPGDNNMTFEEFSHASQAITEREIPDIRPLADMVFDNDLSTIELVRQFAEKVVGNIYAPT
jgi:uridine kinase